MTIFELLQRPGMADVTYRVALGGVLGTGVRREDYCTAGSACLGGVGTCLQLSVVLSLLKPALLLGEDRRRTCARGSRYMGK
jgi:hypothetical protein